MVDTVRKFGHTSKRVQMFGMMAGILRPHLYVVVTVFAFCAPTCLTMYVDRYAPRISYLVMALYRTIFGSNFSATTLKNRK